MQRALGGPASILAQSDGVSGPGQRPALRRRGRGAAPSAYYSPYHRAIDTAIEAAFERGVVPALIAVHSFTPEMDGIARPWHIGILWDRDTRLARGLIDLLAADPAVVVGENEPYSGREDAGYSMHHHGGRRGIPNVLIEVRRDLIDSSAGVERWSAVLAGALRRLLEAAGPFHVEAG